VGRLLKGISSWAMLWIIVDDGDNEDGRRVVDETGSGESVADV